MVKGIVYILGNIHLLDVFQKYIDDDTEICVTLAIMRMCVFPKM